MLKIVDRYIRAPSIEVWVSVRGHENSPPMKTLGEQSQEESEADRVDGLEGIEWKLREAQTDTTPLEDSRSSARILLDESAFAEIRRGP